MGKLLPFRRTKRTRRDWTRPAAYGVPKRRRAGGDGWLAAARGLGPILVAAPLAAFTAVWLLSGPPEAEAGSGADGRDGESAHFSRCAGPIRVTCVIDGDTIWYRGEKIRIADINTPEVSDPDCDYERRLGERATARMTALLNDGAFSIEPNPDGRDTDKYHRKLRILTRDGRSLGDTLVREGLAEEWQGFRRDWC
ncbi:thermonuclease family protein [Erythrobacter sp. 3-20A1M]|uniref:thermonuclease family protein n=1 Tax=Erythrobacter sp. 3-20A1M TaxID=2653850 RepID=UPI001BFCC19E|nr:thermonuclease family protein [Erythrobacter sp. 3-20A1M]QWC57139.1 thermonuclease family protein [Erythrobacter sp. 3-20A1M]